MHVIWYWAKLLDQLMNYSTCDHKVTEPSHINLPTVALRINYFTISTFSAVNSIFYSFFNDTWIMFFYNKKQKRLQELTAWFIQWKFTHAVHCAAQINSLVTHTRGIHWISYSTKQCHSFNFCARQHIC